MDQPLDLSTVTPLMRQVYELKAEHPDKLLMIRMGDFYELFGEDARKAATLLGITLTSRSHGNSERVPLAGVPYHAVDRYLARLVALGERVVIVEQVEDPKTAKGLVKREVVDIITPGTASLDQADPLDSRPLIAIASLNGRRFGLAILEFTTGHLDLEECDETELADRILVRRAAEIVIPESSKQNNAWPSVATLPRSIAVADIGDHAFDTKRARQLLERHFDVATLDGFGVSDLPLALGATGAIYEYLRLTHKEKLGHILSLARGQQGDEMYLDAATVRTLELVQANDDDPSHTLFGVINRCSTPMGGRRLQSAILRPWIKKETIQRRQDGVAEFVRERGRSLKVRELLATLPDLERLVGKLGTGRINPRQLRSLGDACLTLEQIRREMHGVSSAVSKSLVSSLPSLTNLGNRLITALVNEPPILMNRGGMIATGYSQERDDAVASIADAKSYIATLQPRERERTGINTLKVGYNQIFGYYLEVTKANQNAVPADYIRKQTLVNAERYITPELKAKEEIISTAEEKIFALEERLFQELVQSIANQIADLSLAANMIAELDLILSLAQTAVEKKYVQPFLHDDCRLAVKGARHAVIETVLPSGSFISNDVLMSPEQRFAVLTGPNMAGKSTYLRQIGLIVILAQIGSFVPAASAEIGIVDRVFTRVGASDNLSRGQSTFMVEMLETANIMHHANDRSLVLLDEIGRGTSTFDGLSVAWSVAEYLITNRPCRALFATHYRELTALASLFSTVFNLQVVVTRIGDQVLFMHQVVAGACDDSYGVDVARLAGLPSPVIKRARQILKLLETGKFATSELGRGLFAEQQQTNLFEAQESEIERQIRALDIDRLSPLEAFELVRRLKTEATS